MADSNNPIRVRVTRWVAGGTGAVSTASWLGWAAAGPWGALIAFVVVFAITCGTAVAVVQAGSKAVTAVVEVSKNTKQTENINSMVHAWKSTPAPPRNRLVLPRQLGGGGAVLPHDDRPMVVESIQAAGEMDR